MRSICRDISIAYKLSYFIISKRCRIYGTSGVRPFSAVCPLTTHPEEYARMVLLDVSHIFVFNNTLQTSSLGTGIYDVTTNVWLNLI
jgi:hypothetical protein